MKNTLLTAVVVAIVFATSSWGGETRNTVRFGLDYWRPNGQLESEAFLPGTNVGSLSFTERWDVDSSFGAHVAYEQRLATLIGVDFGLGWTEADVDDNYTDCDYFGSTCETTVEMMPATVAMHLYFAPKTKLNVYAGPVFGYLWIGDLKTTADPPIYGVSRATRKLDDAVLWGAVIGFDYPFGGGTWAFSTSLRYLRAFSHQDTDFESLNIRLEPDPFILFVGAGYRFGRGG